MQEMAHKYCVFVYILTAALVAVALFLYGFFPITQTQNKSASDIPKTVNKIRVKSEILYKPIVKRVVLMVIDALRWDFIDEKLMPVSSKLINSNLACLQKVQVNPPTVTMPRIKALTTGTVSGFVDVALNFGSPAVSSDSILRQALKHGHKLIFYGDDTWLKLFPKTFQRHDGTTSFFVSDYTQVDDNVTRHLDDELNNRTDWSVMILHYLGLDHIGHLYGPKSPLIKPKLHEMDAIVEKITQRIDRWNSDGIPSLLMLCGDHGMKDSGGHGGSTPEETFVPLISFGTACTSDTHHQIDQVDIAATLAMMLGVSLPSSSIGRVSLNLAEDLPLASKLFVLYYNAQHLAQQISNSDTPSEYLKAVEMHTEWLQSNKSRDFIHEIIEKYKVALKKMKNTLLNSMINYNYEIMSAAIVLIFQSLFIMLNNEWNHFFSVKKFTFWILFATISGFLVHCTFQSEWRIEFNYLLMLIGVLITVNCSFCSRINVKSFVNNFVNVRWIYPLGMFIYTMSLTGSSFVEEEHQIWYFFWATFLALQLYTHVSQVPRSNFRSIFKLLSVLMAHRVLKHMNSTGNKYAHLPDIGGWLRHRQIEMSLVLIMALGLLIAVGYVSEASGNRTCTLILYLIASCGIYLRHSSENTVIRPFFYPESRGIYEVQVVWICLACIFIRSLINIYQLNNYLQRVNEFNKLLIQMLTIISALLHRPQNVLLLPIQIIASAIIHSVSESNNSLDRVYISYCLGNVFYFYQGNSNSLATIDVAAGYVGLQSYNLIITTVFLCINTFVAPVLAYLMLLHQITVTKDTWSNVSEKIDSTNQTYTILKFFPLAIYTIIMSIHRYHLFIWSVFAPKLLYEATYCAVIFIVILFTQVIVR